jgi:demethylmenaquinone methyltransferase/2-methoxy-6-polyprenyl-1,4-benzoquinol methylase
VASVSDPNTFASNLFSGLPKRYDLLAEILSFGQNHRWRSAMVKPILTAQPARILDVATGTAGVALLLAENCGAQITGLDLSEPMLRQGQVKVMRSSYAHRVHLVMARGEQLPFPDNVFDALTFTYLLRYVSEPAAALMEMARVVKPGGVMASLEFFVPPNPFWRALWWLYTRLILPIGGWLGGRAWYEVGRFLGPSISRHYRDYPLAWTLDAWRAAGLAEVNFRVSSLGGGLVMWGRKAEA